MAKKQPKQFSPHIYQEWGELFKHLTDKQKAEILMAITMYPNYQPTDNPVWGFIQSQIEREFDDFNSRCMKNGEISRDYWNRMKSNDIERIPNDIERHPKLELEQEHKQEQELKENKEKVVDNFIKSFGSEHSFVNNKILISSQLSLVEMDNFDINAYRTEFGDKVVNDVNEWLIKNKLGQRIDKSFILKQIANFANRQKR